jgi:hypothetical protein
MIWCLFISDCRVYRRLIALIVYHFTFITTLFREKGEKYINKMKLTRMPKSSDLNRIILYKQQCLFLYPWCREERYYKSQCFIVIWTFCQVTFFLVTYIFTFKYFSYLNVLKFTNKLVASMHVALYLCREKCGECSLWRLIYKYYLGISNTTSLNTFKFYVYCHLSFRKHLTVN